MQQVTGRKGGGGSVGAWITYDRDLLAGETASRKRCHDVAGGGGNVESDCCTTLPKSCEATRGQVREMSKPRDEPFALELEKLAAD